MHNRTRQGCPWLVVLALLTGCTGTREQLHTTLLTDRNPATRTRDLESLYQVRCPDVLLIEFAGRPDLSGRHPVGIDGQVVLPGGGSVPADGLTVPQIARAIATRHRLPPSGVKVRVAEYKSQHLYLFGEVEAGQQVIPYRGPETAVELLQRLGGTAPTAALGDIRVVRAHVADGLPPEVFHIDLTDILVRHDLQTNIQLQPFDRIHIGPTRRSQVACHLPPWMGWMCRGGDARPAANGKKPGGPGAEPGAR